MENIQSSEILVTKKETTICNNLIHSMHIYQSQVNAKTRGEKCCMQNTLNMQHLQFTVSVVSKQRIAVRGAGGGGGL